MGTFLPTAYGMDLVHITCIPESSYFEITFHPVEEDEIFFGTFEPKIQKRRLAVWKNHGYFDASDLRQTCRTAGATYRVTSSEPPGSNRECGAVTRVTLTLTRNGEALLDKVLFGPSPEPNCDKRPGITSLSIREGKNGWGGPQWRICLSKTGWIVAPWLNEYSSFSGEFCDYNFVSNFNSVFPLNQEHIEYFFAHKPLSGDCESLDKAKRGLCK
jgi:hypothetical protein